MSQKREKQNKTYEATVVVAVSCDKCGGDAAHPTMKGHAGSVRPFYELTIESADTTTYQTRDLCESCGLEIFNQTAANPNQSHEEK